MGTFSVTPTTRCAIYTRKATLERNDDAQDAQRAAGEAHIRSHLHAGWMLVPERYDDAGYSGLSLERPALQRLLEDVKSGKVQMVVVDKIDRLSRSQKDFSKIVGILEKHGASFVSVTERLGNATAVERLHLFLLLSGSARCKKAGGRR